MRIFRNALITAAACLSATAALAQESPGAALFAERCAVCHGASGAGDGIVGELFAQRPKDLRVLSRENGGVFPLDRVMQSIDGRAKIGAHGNSNMPIWGDALMEEALVDRGINPKDARMVTEGRIMALTMYIEGLQAD